MAWPTLESLGRTYRTIFLESPVSGWLATLTGPYYIFFGWRGQPRSVPAILAVASIPLFSGGLVYYAIHYQERLARAIFQRRRSPWPWTTRLIQACSLAGSLVGYVELGRRLRSYPPWIHFGGKTLLTILHLGGVVLLESLIPPVPLIGLVRLPPPPKG